MSKSTAKSAAPPKKAVKKPAPAAGRTPAKKAVARPAPKKAAKPAPKKATKPAPKKTAKPAAKPAKKPAARPAPKPVPKAAPKAAAKPAAKPTKPRTPTPVPVTKPAAKPDTKKSAPPPVQAKPVPQVKPATRTPAKASAKAEMIAARTAVADPAPASRFADRFAPMRPAARPVVLDEPARPVIKIDPRLVNAWKGKAGRDLTEPELLAMPDSEYMNEKQLEFFRVRLTALKDDLLSNAGETTEHLREDTSIVPDPADRATIEEEHALELRTRDRERKLLKKISQSLARIEAGDYGYCDETGEPIGLARLLARPTATLSLEAQQRREMKQKMFGD
ncbi:MAG: RNA polymerase-binding protein DksA [Aquincola sp.]|nr:RNA polymerase-binding protein DksA [Aquincola sp.]MDH5330610.1 RNA polymerase-binding protein DksA [Aquincola sp.]